MFARWKMSLLLILTGLLLLNGSTWAGNVIFVRIRATTNTTITSLGQSGTVTWTNAAVGGTYVVETASSLSGTAWDVIESGTITNEQQSCWVDVAQNSGLQGIHGAVFWNSAPVAGKYVELVQPAGWTILRSSLSAADGTFGFGQVSNGSYLIGSPDDPPWAEGYNSLTVDGSNVTVNVELHKRFQITSPSDGSTIADTTPNIVWTAQSQAAYYYVQLYEWFGSHSRIEDSIVNSGTAYQVQSVLQSGKRYLVLVDGINASDSSIYSGQSMFLIE